MCDTLVNPVSGFSPEIHNTNHEMAESRLLRLYTSKEDERMVDKEMLAAISDLLDQKLEEKLEEKLEAKLEEKLEPIYDRLDKLDLDMKYVRVFQLENQIIPRLNTIEQSYLDTSVRYMEKAEQIDEMSRDIAVLKSVVEDHSERLNRLLV